MTYPPSGVAVAALYSGNRVGASPGASLTTSTKQAGGRLHPRGARTQREDEFYKDVRAIARGKRQDPNVPPAIP